MGKKGRTAKTKKPNTKLRDSEPKKGVKAGGGMAGTGLASGLVPGTAGGSPGIGIDSQHKE